MYRSAADPDQHDFDLERELEALEQQGYVFLEELPARALEIAQVVESLGWQGACEVLDETWEGWEAEVLLEVILSHLEIQEGKRARAENRRMAALLGARRG